MIFRGEEAERGGIHPAVVPRRNSCFAKVTAGKGCSSGTAPGLLGLCMAKVSILEHQVKLRISEMKA